MLAILYSLSKAIDALNERVGQLVSWLNIGLVLLVCFDVVTRRWFDDSAAWVSELEWHLFALIFLIGAGYTFKHGKHVRVDLFYTKMKAQDKALINFLGNLIFLLPWTSIICYYSFFYARTSFEMLEKSPDPGGLPARYLIKFMIVVGLFLLFLQGVAEIGKAARVLWKEKSTDPS